MAELLYTYEKYGVEILGAAVTVLLVLQCVQLIRMHKLKKQLNQMAGRRQLKDEMERMGRRDSVRRENPVGTESIIGRRESSLKHSQVRQNGEILEDSSRMQSRPDEDAGRRGLSGENAGGQGNFGGREREYALSEDQSQLISEVLGEIFP